MRFALMKTGVAAGIFLAVRVAMANDGGEPATDPDATTPATVQDAAVTVDGSAIACDGAICATNAGSTCSVAITGPGLSAPSRVSLLGILSILAFTGLQRRPDARRPGALRPTSRP